MRSERKVTTPALVLLAGLIGCAKAEKKEQPVEQPVVEQTRAAPEPEPEKPKEPEKDPFESLDTPGNVANPPSSATTTKAGITYKVMRNGTGKVKPRKADTVHVHYTSWNPETGKRTSTSRKKGVPKKLRVGKAVPGWRAMFLEMTEGERRRVWLPSKLAHPRSKRRKGGPRTVDFEMMRVVVAPDAPADVKKAPRDAKASPSGLKWIVLKPGKGEKPGADASVTVKYSGWTRDGVCFDHTPDDETRTFSLGSVIPGWTEGMQDMAAGEKRRFWIPKKLAYAGKDGKPEGTLVFEVELMEFASADPGKPDPAKPGDSEPPTLKAMPAK
jgi:FKBP-type peptidyl-prolyl cis-trans isomerase